MPIIVIAGVTGVGKTSIANKLKKIYHWDYIEADDFHSPLSIEKMRSGIALTDEDRLPWLQRLHEKFDEYASCNQSCIITCSALRKTYRQILLTGSTEFNSSTEISGQKCYIIILTLSRDTLYQRLIERQNQHFMNPNLIDSQLETLELPTENSDEPYTYILNCDGLSQDQVIDQIKLFIQQ